MGLFWQFHKLCELYPDRLPDGCILKSIHFDFPVFYEGKEMERLCRDNKITVETVVSLTKK